MLWGIRRSFTNWKNIFRRPFGRGSIYRLERLRSVARLEKNRENGKIDDEKNKISVDKGIKKYEKRKLNAKKQKRRGIVSRPLRNEKSDFRSYSSNKS